MADEWSDRRELRRCEQRVESKGAIKLSVAISERCAGAKENRH